MAKKKKITSESRGRGISLRCVDGWYHVRFFNSKRTPREVNFKLNTDYKPAAEEKLRDMLRRIDLGTFDPWTQKIREITLREAKGLYRKAKKGVSKPHTIDKIVAVIDTFVKQSGFDENNLIQRIEPRHLQAFVYRPSLSAGSQFSYYNKLKVFFNWIKQEGYLPENPVLSVKAPRRPKGLPKFLLVEQVDLLLRTIEADYEMKRTTHRLNSDQDVIWLRDFVELAAFTGLRRGELISLRWGDVLLTEPGYIQVRAHVDEREGEKVYSRPKADSEGVIPLVGRARRVLERLQQTRTSESPAEHVFKGVLSGGPLYGNFVSQQFRKYRDMAHLPKVPLHGLRHTFAVFCKTLGFNDELTQSLMRHSSIAMVRTYGALPIEMVAQDVIDAFERLEK